MAKPQQSRGVPIRLGGVKPRAQTLQRVEEAQRLLMQMLPYSVVCRRLAERFAISDRQASQYIAKAREAWAKLPQPDPEARREQLRSAFGLHYVECMAKGAYGPAGRALMALAELEGVLSRGSRAATQADAAENANDITYQDPSSVRERMCALARKHQDKIRELARSGESVAGQVVEIVRQPKAPVSGPAGDDA